MTGLVVFGHGSSVAAANQAVMRQADLLRQRGDYPLVQTAFLEAAEPSLPQAVDMLVAQGATRVIVIPYFLTLGIHLRRDLPRIVEEIGLIHTGVRIDVTEPLDGHPFLVDILLDRARAAVQQ